MVFTLEISQIMRVRVQSQGEGDPLSHFPFTVVSLGNTAGGPFQTMEAVLSQQDANYLWIPLRETPLSPEWKTGQSQALVCP